MGTETIILSSSPARPLVTYSFDVAISSSPRLPSPGGIFGKRPHVRTGNQAVPYPVNAINMFSSISNFSTTTTPNPVNAGQFAAVGAFLDDTTTNILVKPKATSEDRAEKDWLKLQGEVENVRKPRGMNDDIDGITSGEEVKEKPARKPRAKIVDKTVNEDGQPKEKPPRKPRAKKADGKGQTKLPKGKVTKPTVDPKSEKVAKLKKTSTVSKHFTSATKDSLNPSNEPVDEDLLLTNAMKRRSTWTPPKPTPITSIIDSPISFDTSGNIDSPALLEHSDGEEKQFSDFLGSFSYDKTASVSASIRSIELIGVRKRKLVELVKTNASGTTRQSTSKIKAPKKKPRTITELATSAYAVDTVGDQSPAPLLQYFPLNPSGESAAADGFKIPPNPQLRSPIKSGKKNGKREATTSLLSPQSALKHVSNQEFVFGTSSQLAREESPTLLRDLQQAMLESNQIDNPFTDDFVSLSRHSSHSSSGNLKRSLWSAASRDSQGELMDIEVVDMSTSPGVTTAKANSQPKRIEQPVEVGVFFPTPEPGDWHCIGESLVPTKEAALDFGHDKRSVGPVEAAIRVELLSSPASTEKPGICAPPQVSKSSPRKKLPPKTSNVVTKGSELGMPDFQSYSTAQLAKEIASYRFKPVKNRDQMILLLQKCWEGKQRVALGDVGPTAILQTSPSKCQPSRNISTIASATSTSTTKSRGSSGNESKVRVSLSKTQRKPKKPVSTSTDESEPLTDVDTRPTTSRTPKRANKRKTRLVSDEISDSETQLTPSPPRREAFKIGVPPLPLELSVSPSSCELSPTSEERLLHKQITRAITSAPRANDPKFPSWHEKILMYDPVILEDLTAWLNTGGLEKSGWDGEVDVKEVRKWCVERSVCCLWRQTRRGEGRSRF